MRRFLEIVAISLAVLLALSNAYASKSRAQQGMVWVEAGVWRPFYPPSPLEKEIPVKRFLIDALPVTNSDFLKFVKEHPEWQRHQVASIFADANYLNHWAGSVNLGSAKPQQAVVNVSWFAAKAYCEARGLRLLREAEWELAAQATETKPDGSKDLIWRQRILNWYARPNAKVVAEVGKSPRNYWGIYDLHGLIWEWVLDFNSTMFSVDNRGEGDANRFGFCGSGSLKASEKEDYASFMRMAFRSSLKATYTTTNLGFRCATDGKEERL